MAIAKTNKTVLSVYRAIGSLLLKGIAAHTPIQRNKVFFSCFGGRRYDDSPRAIYEAMIRDKRFGGCEFVWAFHYPDHYTVPKGRVVKTDTIRYFKEALSSRVWVTNSSIRRGLNFKGKENYCFNTWHGTPIKKLGNDLHNSILTAMRDPQKETNDFDTLCIQGIYDEGVFERAFKVPKEKMLRSGLPRNDELVDSDHLRRMEVRSALGVDNGTKVILYAPTFREYERGMDSTCELSPPITTERWRQVLGASVIVLFRAHYEVAKTLGIVFDDSFFFDVSDYTNLNDLILASDMLVSDYSSLFFDYSITGKPMFSFCYDYEEYEKRRGIYIDIRDEIEWASNEEELLKLLKKVKVGSTSEQTVAFRDKYVNFYGSATLQCLDAIADVVTAGDIDEKRFYKQPSFD